MLGYIIFEKGFNISALLYLCLSIRLGSSDSTDTWIKAQNHCWQSGKDVKNTPNEGKNYYWTGYYIRLSSWIKILGCYLDSDLTDLIKINHTMQYGSAGFCQELCMESDHAVFGVKLDTCVCLNDKPRQNSRQPSECQFVCVDKFNDTDLNFSKECGGNSTYNIFTSDIQEGMTDQNNTRCMSLQCADSSKKFTPYTCKTSYARICNHTAIAKYNAWKTSLEICRNANRSYLLGNVKLNYPSEECKGIHNIGDMQGPMWIGVANEIYISVFRGNHSLKYIGNMQERKPQKCLKCNSTCIFVNCNDINSFACGKFLETEAHATGTTAPFDSVHSTNTAIFETITTHHTNTEENSEAGSLIYIILPLGLVILLLASAVLIFILWKRKMSTNKKDKEKTLESVPVKNVNAEINQSPSGSYFVLEKKNFHKSTPESILTSENPYDDIEEGDYDHLRGKRSKKTEEEEDTYHHSSAGISAGVSDYDIMARSVKTVQEEDGGYDHVHPDIKRNSDYGKKEEYAKTLTDDPYDISIKS